MPDKREKLSTKKLPFNGNDNFQPCVCATLRQAARAVTQVYDNALRPLGLRATQFHTLAEIRTAGEATVTELTRLLLIDQTTLTRNLSLLQKAGLVKEVPKPDGRVKAVQLTTKGNQLLRKAFPLWASAQEAMIGVVGASAWISLSVDLRRLARLTEI
jgi:DNA-binding MarR family transcriptional regulator